MLLLSMRRHAHLSPATEACLIKCLLVSLYHHPILHGKCHFSTSKVTSYISNKYRDRGVQATTTFARMAWHEALSPNLPEI